MINKRIMLGFGLDLSIVKIKLYVNTSGEDIITIVINIPQNINEMHEWITWYSMKVASKTKFIQKNGKIRWRISHAISFLFTIDIIFVYILWIFWFLKDTYLVIKSNITIIKVKRIKNQ